jgi:hypothetical protein
MSASTSSLKRREGSKVLPLAAGTESSYVLKF